MAHARWRNVCGRAAACFILLGIATGCEFKYRATTVLHPDGSVDREVYQPAGEGNDEGPRAAGWANPPVVAKDNTLGGRDYFAASGHFASADKVPDHFVARWSDQEKYDLPADLPPGRLVRRAKRVDYVFVTQHEWVETLTDGVTYEGARKARDELADLGITLGRDILEEAVGREYDVSDLEKWAKTEGKAWLAEMTDYAFVQMLILKQPQAAMAGGDPLTATTNGLLDIWARHGLDVRKDGKLATLPEKERDAAIDNFLTDLACRTIRRKSDGKPVDRETARLWVKELNRKNEPAAADAPPAGAEPPERPPTRFEVAGKKVIEAKYGGEDALKKRAAPLAVRLGGWYWPDVFSVRTFEYTLTMPGAVVWTNGEALADDRVRWNFDARMAWPLGYDMACRSLEPQTKLQENLLKGKPLADRQAMADFVALFGRPNPLEPQPLTVSVTARATISDVQGKAGDPPPRADPAAPAAAAPANEPKVDVSADPKARLLQALKDCREAKSMAPLYKHRDEVVAAANGGSSVDIQRVWRLFELLKLPEKP